MKFRHNQKITTYQCTDYAKYRAGEAYLHPTMIIRRSRVLDAMEMYRQFGDDSYLRRAKLLREATGNTLFVDHFGGFDDMLELRWQTHLEGNWSDSHYPPLYACKIANCSLSSESLSIAAKLAKAAEGWSTQPLQIVAKLIAIKAVCVTWHAEADAFVAVDHLTDNMFGLAEDLRRNSVAK